MRVVENLSIIKEKSDEFDKQNKFPTTSTRCIELESIGHNQERLLRNANSAYPLIHHTVLRLIINFLKLKRKTGSKVEKNIYENISIEGFTDRLLAKRPKVFCGQFDHYILRDSSKTGLAEDDWHKVGTDEEEKPFLMADYLTYDEGKLAALLGASTHTVTVNKGGRKNESKPDPEGTYISDGVIVGLVGPRMHKEGAMERQEMLVSEEQNKTSKGYGDTTSGVLKLFAEFYGMKHVPTFREVDGGEISSLKGIFHCFINKTARNKTSFDEDHIQISRGKSLPPYYLNSSVYQQRIRICAEVLLAEANDRARLEGKLAYVHVVGLGLGVWRVCNEQRGLFASVFVQAVVDMQLEHVADLDFSWVLEPLLDDPVVKLEDLEVKAGDLIPGTSTRLHISQRDPWEKLEQERLVVASWAWDGMSFVGNEYWAGSLQSSSDPAAACCTQIAELLNPWVNPAFCGQNSRVVTSNGNIVTLAEMNVN